MQSLGADQTSATESTYLIQLYLLLREGRRVVGARIAERVGVSPPAVSQALRRLEQHGLVLLDPDDGAGLTDRGRKEAENTIRRHYLLERLLVDELGFNWVDVDEEADRLEHSLSPRLEAHLFDRLGRPTTCPHGNPFPGSADEQRLLNARRLSDLEEGEVVTIVRITEDAEGNEKLMHRINDSHLRPGVEIRILRTSKLDLELVRTEDGGTAVLPTEFARFIRVE